MSKDPKAPEERLFRRLRKSDINALRKLCEGDRRWSQYYRDHRAWVERAIEDLSGADRAVFGCFSPVPDASKGWSSRLDACIFLKLSEYDNSAELKNLIFHAEDTPNELSESSISAAARLIEKTARYCETREVNKLEIELPQIEHTFISLFLKQGFRVAALRERYYPGQSVCILEKKIGEIYSADPFELEQLGKWLLRAILPCKVGNPMPCQLQDDEIVKYLPFEMHPTHPAFSSANPVGYEKRLQGWLIILDEDDCTPEIISQIPQSRLREHGQLHYVLAYSLTDELRTLLQNASINCFEVKDLKMIAGSEKSSLNVPMRRTDIGGVLTVLEAERIIEYSRHDNNFIYYLLSGIGSALPRHEAENGSTLLLAVYCPYWTDGESGIVAIAEIDEIADSSFDQALELYAEIPKALTEDDLKYYKTRSDKNRLHVLKCGKLISLSKPLTFGDPLWDNQEKMRGYLVHELEQTNSAYISTATCESLREYLKLSPPIVGSGGKDTDWDVFISHASEDNDEIAAPLAEALRNAGLRVWYDNDVLQIGDSLWKAINHGLAKSRFGIVILSHSFFASDWSNNEVQALFSKEVGGEKVILTVRHKITMEEIKARAPLLAGRLAGDTSDMKKLVRKLQQAMGFTQANRVG